MFKLTADIPGMDNMSEGKMTIKLLTYQQAAEILGVENIRSFYNLVARGVLPESLFVHIPGLGKRVRADRLEKFIEQHSRH